MVHKHDGSVCTLVLTSRFGMVLVQQGEKPKHKIASFFIKQWFTEQIALSLNKLNYNKNFPRDKNLLQLLL